MKIYLSLALLALSACAQGPKAIAPVPAPSGFYDRLSCSQAQAQRNKIQTDLAALETKQRGAVVGEAIGVFLVLVPVSSLTGSNVAGELGAEKGKLQAVDARLMSC